MMSEQKKIGDIIVKLLALEQEAKHIDEEKKVLWNEFFAIADKNVGVDKPYRYFDRELEYVIARSVSVTEILNETALEKLLTPYQWNTVTIVVRQLDRSMLQGMVNKGRIAPEIVKEATERKPIIKRLLHRASKNDLEN